MKPVLSIIVPTLNSASTLPALLDSVFMQDCHDYELVVIDGGSTDATLSILKENCHRLIYISESDSGIYDAMNKGVNVAQGEWLYFIGADDSLYANDVLSKLMQHLNSDTDIVLCDIMSPTLGRYKSRFSSLTFFTNTIQHQGAIYRRQLLLQHPYDTSLHIVADYELNLYLWHNNCRVSHAHLILANHSPYGVSGKVNTLNYREEIIARNRYLSNPLQRALFTFVSWSKYTIKPLVNYLRKLSSVNVN